MRTAEKPEVLAEYFPGLFDMVACIFNCVEDGVDWPSPVVQGYIALIPKDEEDPEPEPTAKRPIAVPSVLYRLWAKLRFDDAMDNW